MEHTIIQPDESQTFLFKYGPYGEEHQFNAKEILQKMRAYYQQDFDSIVLLPYAYDAFGYFIAGCQIWDGSANEIYLQNEELMSIGYDYVIAVRPLYSDIMPMCAFGTDGQTSYSFGTTSMGTYYDGPPDYYIWNCFRGDYPVPFVFYTECDCPHIFINGTEYHSGDATVRVNYYLPDSDYEYARLTYKKNDKPESVNDGTIVPISPSDSYVDVENLVEGKSYYFKIFTSKSESEAFPYTIPIDPVPPEYREYIDTINGSGFFWKDFTYTNAASPYPAVNPVPATVSFYNRRNWTNAQNPIGNQTNGTGSMMVSSIMTFNITSSNDSFTATLSGYNPEIQEGKTANNVYYIPFEAVDQVFRNIASSINAYTFNNSYRIAVFEYQFNTLQICLQCIATHFRNVNIYVDGVLWTKVS